MVGPWLEQIQSPLASVKADGAYDAESVYRAMAERQRQPSPTVIIPPQATAVPSSAPDTANSSRGRPIQLIRETGRRGGGQVVGYGKRSLVETAMFRYQIRIGPRLRARTFAAQKGEARTAYAVLNRMTQLGIPISQWIR